MAPKYELQRECMRQQQTRKKDQAEEVPCQDKTLHGMYQTIDIVGSSGSDIVKSYQSLGRAGLKDRTETLIIAT